MGLNKYNCPYIRLGDSAFYFMDLRDMEMFIIERLCTDFAMIVGEFESEVDALGITTEELEEWYSQKGEISSNDL